MKKKTILNLIKAHSEKNDAQFKNNAYEIAKEFSENGDEDISEYIMSLLSDTQNTFSPQNLTYDFSYLKRIDSNQESILLPEPIKNDVIGICNAVSHNIGVSKFLFQGDPGTGKTETAKQIARILGRELYIVNFEELISSKLGDTAKNISKLFKEINSFNAPLKTIVLFDEIDALVLSRENDNDVREMGRATSTFLKYFDELNKDTMIIATTNLYKYLDKAIKRRFDATIDFNRYSRKDLLDISLSILDNILQKNEDFGRNKTLFLKIINLYKVIPYPADLKNVIRTSIAFSTPGQKFDYLNRLYCFITNSKKADSVLLKKQGFTLREIEQLTGIPKSSLSREFAKKEH